MSSNAKAPDLTIVVPAYREEKRLGKTLDSLAAYLRDQSPLKSLRVEVVVVAADAPDRTLEIARSREKLFDNFVLLKPGPKVGKGRDVRVGMLAAKGNVVMFMDADMATPLWHIAEFYDFCMQGDEVVVGVRDLARYRHDLPRILVSLVGNILYRLAGGIWLEDSQCGFKMFRGSAVPVCFDNLQIKGWGFDMEVLAAAKANKLRVRTVHIADYTDMPHSTFQDNLVRNSAHAFGDLALIFWRRITGTYRRAARRGKER